MTQGIELYFNRATRYYNEGKYEEAIETLTLIINSDAPDDIKAGAYNNRGLAKHDLQRYEEAIEDYDKAIELQPKLANAWFNRGNAKGSLQRHEEAIADFDTAIELQPDYAKAYHNRGVAKHSLGRYEEAIRDYYKAIELQCEKVKKDFKTITCYKFIPISKNSIDMLVKNMVYFSDVPFLNDPLECPLLLTIFQGAFEGDHEPRIFSLVVPPPNDKPDENGIHEVVQNTLLFSHYADAHKGMCIGYEIAPEFLQQGTMFYTPVQYSKNTRPDRLEKLFAIKDELWKYEHEGRFVAFGTKKHYALEGNSRITRLIFGLKTPEEDKTLLSKLLQGKGIDLYDIYSDEYSSFDLKFRKHEATPF